MSSMLPATMLTTHNVQCANKGRLADVTCPFPLGPFDHLLPPFAAIAVVFIWRRPQLDDSAGNDPIISVDVLHKALARLLDFYPHLTGRLRVNAKDGTTEIHELGTGALLSSAICESSLPRDVAQLAPEDMPGQGNALLAEFNGAPDQFSKEPILSIQHTRFGCGSVSLGVRLNHSVCDARGFLQLMEDLTEIYRALTATTSVNTVKDVQPQQLPCITSYLSNAHLSPRESREALHIEPADYYVEEIPTVMTFKSDKPVAGKFLHFSQCELFALKNAASTSKDRWTSTFEALSAHLWQSVQRARICHQKSSSESLPEACEETADLLTSLDWRSPTRLNLPPRYFPNAVSEPFITLPLNNLSADSLPQTAQLIHDTLQSRTSADQLETLSWVIAQPNKNNISLRSRFNEKSFIISQWNKLDMYAIYFARDEHGNCILPDRVWPPFTETSLVDGLAYLLPTKRKANSDIGDSGIEVALSLHEPLWDILESDPDFRKFSDL